MGVSEFIVVAIGSSAGGVQACESFFRAVSDKPGMAFVVVSHLDRTRPSMLSSIIGRFTGLPVLPAEDGQVIEVDNVYVMQAGMVLGIEDGRLRSTPVPADQRVHNPIDVFFGSLALELGDRSVAIVLSGTGSDGTLGIKAVKERGGLTMAQGHDHTIPKYDGMPSSAIASGLVDLVVPVQDMPARLVAYAADRAGDPSRPPQKATPLHGARKEIQHLLKAHVGHDFKGYKPSSFDRRVQRRMQVLQIGDAPTYLECLRGDTDEVARLFRDLLISVTSFFRDAHAFDALCDQVLPQLFAGRGPHDTVRIWVPGCATGEEAYSVAALLWDYAAGMPDPPLLQIFATDIDEPALTIARAGRYPVALLAHVEPARRERFFVADGGALRIRKEIRDLCVFSTHSVIRDPPFSRIDLVSCRNLLIYLGAGLQARVISIFHFALRPGGYLFLGGAENVTQHPDLFAPLDKSHRLFRRHDRNIATLALPVVAQGGFLPGHIPLAMPGSGGSARDLRRAAEARVLERFAPPHVVVDQHGDIVFYSARTGRYLEPAVGAPSRNLVGMARKGLRLDLRVLLRETAQSRRSSSRQQVPVEIDGRTQLVNIAAELLDGPDASDLFLVVFDGAPAVQQVGTTTDAVIAGLSGAELVEQELQETRERLQTVVEEYETAAEELKASNEDLLSANEELQSANEELETGKEELQSVNEELSTLNVQLADKVEQLDRANGDLVIAHPVAAGCRSW